jgi:hypothetical protein
MLRGKDRSRGETCAISHIGACYQDLKRGTPWTFAPPVRRAIALSSEVGTGPREENGSKKTS